MKPSPSVSKPEGRVLRALQELAAIVGRRVLPWPMVRRGARQIRRSLQFTRGGPGAGRLVLLQPAQQFLA